MTVSDTLSPRIVTHKMVENLAKTKAAEAPVEEKKKRGRKPKAQSATIESTDVASNRKPGCEFSR